MKLLGIMIFASILLPLVPSAGAMALPQDREPPVILLLPPLWAAGTDDLVLRARVTDASRIADVMLWVRGQHDKEFRPVPMHPAGLDGHRAQLPSWPGQGDQVTYYVEATDRLGNGPRRSGSPKRPFIAHHEATPPAARPSMGLSYPQALFLFLPPLLILWVMHRHELRQRERVFWQGVLASLWDKRGRDLAFAIDQVCSRTHRHPRRGPGTLSKLEARRWLEHLRPTA